MPTPPPHPRPRVRQSPQGRPWGLRVYARCPRPAFAGGCRPLVLPRTGSIEDYAKNAVMAAVSSENAQRSTALPSRMWKISAVRYTKVRPSRVAVAVPSAIV